MTTTTTTTAHRRETGLTLVTVDHGSRETRQEHATISEIAQAVDDRDRRGTLALVALQWGASTAAVLVDAVDRPAVGLATVHLVDGTRILD